MTPKIIRRELNQNVYDALVAEGAHPLVARIIAMRPNLGDSKPTRSWQPKLAYLDHPLKMKDMDIAVPRLVKAINNGECIGIETDHDCDGQTSHAVLHTCLIQMFGHPKDKVRSYIGHRMEEGYGLSESLAKRILADGNRPSLVITADNGSADEVRIAMLKAEGIDVIVTDHHEIPEEGIPESAYACLNPTRDDCCFPDPYIAGCMVAWLFMAATRGALIQSGRLTTESMPMTSVLDFVAVGTVADCVSMARSINNRAIVRYGMKLIDQQKRPCWQAVMPLLKQNKLTSEDIGFVIGPLLNSDGRLADAFGSVNYLLSDNLQEAQKWVQHLYQQNQARKAIQKEMTQQAVLAAQKQVSEGKVSLTIFLDDGHAGVHGISASRIKDQFGRPVVVFSPKLGEPGVLSGSARSIDSLHIRNVLQAIVDEVPGLLIKFGGHRGAAGLSILQKNLDQFTALFEQHVNANVMFDDIGPVILSDGALEEAFFNLETVDLIKEIEPFGREFDTPIFEVDATIMNIRRVGADKTHAQLSLTLASGEVVKAIWFGAAQDEASDVPISEGQQVHVVFSLSDNVFRDRRSLQLMVKSCA